MKTAQELIEPLGSHQIVRPIYFFTLMGILSASASAIQIIEAPLPRILPWLKPGLSNALVLFGMIKVSPLFGIGIVCIRTFLTGILTGIMFSPPHLLSIAGGSSAAAVMALCLFMRNSSGAKTFSAGIGLSGISILGATANNFSQLILVGIFFPGSVPIYMHLAIMIWISIPSGIIVAKLTDEILRRTV